MNISLPALIRLKKLLFFWPPLGITARLSLSFVAVAILAAAANLLARESAAIIYVPKQERVVTPPPQVVVPVASPPVRVLPPPPPPPPDTSRLLNAVDGYERLTRARVANRGAIPDGELQAARSALSHAPNAAAPSIAPRLAAFLAQAQHLMDAADTRRDMRAKYPQYLHSMTQRMQVPMDNAFKIFGRVLARQTLIDLRSHLDTLRQTAEDALAGESVTEERLAALLKSEKLFGDALAANRDRFAKAEGADWVAAMQKDFEGLLVTRTELQAADNALLEQDHKFTQQRLSLMSAIGSLAREPRVVKTPALAAPAAAPAVHVPEFSPAAPLAAEPAALPGPETEHVDRHVLKIMAEVTTAVMLLVTLISIATVRSVTLPVRNMLKGARELAAGTANISVPRGGIRELDTLAAAFNDMAQQLDQARQISRDHQESLETKIQERTHKLQKLAEQDALTSLPNRRRLLIMLNETLRIAQAAGTRVGVYFLDLDNFKNFNDSLGHVFGDRVIMSVANRLEELVEGFGFVARLGGDEFTIVLERAESEEDVRKLGMRLLDAFRDLTSVDDRDLSVSVSIGASFYPDHGKDADELLRAADAALFRAKELGRRQLTVFTPELLAFASHRFTVEQNVRLALERNEFELVYQPEVNLATLDVELVEALLRWRQPDGRLVAPGEFLAIAEQAGLMAQISDFVLRTAVRDAATWHHGGWPAAKVAINVSARELLDPHFTERMLALLSEHRLPPSAVEIELTETVIQTSAGTVQALRELRAQGFCVALDDFGTGFSSLTSLEQLPLTRIKLDRSLIMDVESSPRAAAIAKAIIELCAGLKLEVTAEGIERAGQLKWLLAQGSMFVQGYIFSRPVVPADLLRVRQEVAAIAQDIFLSMDTPKHDPATPPASGKALSA
jgi:diguanylate cyclase (GGDEF)-like protein